jgi:hypothetical protein
VTSLPLLLESFSPLSYVLDSFSLGHGLKVIGRGGALVDEKGEAGRFKLALDQFRNPSSFPIVPSKVLS